MPVNLVCAESGIDLMQVTRSGLNVFMYVCMYAQSLLLNHSYRNTSDAQARHCFANLVKFPAHSFFHH